MTSTCERMVSASASPVPTLRKLTELSNGPAGMTFNVEPAIYIDGLYEIRRCEMVTVAQTDCEILTDFHSDLHELDYRPQLSNLKFLVVAVESPR